MPHPARTKILIIRFYCVLSCWIVPLACGVDRVSASRVSNKNICFVYERHVYFKTKHGSCDHGRLLSGVNHTGKISVLCVCVCFMALHGLVQ